MRAFGSSQHLETSLQASAGKITHSRNSFNRCLKRHADSTFKSSLSLSPFLWTQMLSPTFRKWPILLLESSASGVFGHKMTCFLQHKAKRALMEYKTLKLSLSPLTMPEPPFYIVSVLWRFQPKCQIVTKNNNLDLYDIWGYFWNAQHRGSDVTLCHFQRVHACRRYHTGPAFTRGNVNVFCSPLQGHARRCKLTFLQKNKTKLN